MTREVDQHTSGSPNQQWIYHKLQGWQSRIPSSYLSSTSRMSRPTYLQIPIILPQGWRNTENLENVCVPRKLERLQTTQDGLTLEQYDKVTSLIITSVTAIKTAYCGESQHSKHDETLEHASPAKERLLRTCVTAHLVSLYLLWFSHSLIVSLFSPLQLGNNITIPRSSFHPSSLLQLSLRLANHFPA